MSHSATFTETNESRSRRLGALADQLTALLRDPAAPRGDAHWLLLRCNDTIAMSGDLKLASMHDLEKSVERFNEEHPAFAVRVIDPAFVAERLVWRFHKSGDATDDTMPFASFAKGLRDAIAAQIDAGPHEVPVILHRVSDDSWTLLTTERLLWRVPTAGLISVPLGRIEAVEVDRRAHIGTRLHAFPSKLRIVETDGTEHRIQLEPGNPCYGFMDTIRSALP
jgi:hypothetical protein